MPLPPLPLLETPNWPDAKCKHVEDPDIFFPDRAAGRCQEKVMAAKSVCNGDDGFSACSRIAECLDHALDTGQRFGVWGGLSERQRHKEKKRRIEAAKKAEQEREARRKRRSEAARRAWETRRSNARSTQETTTVTRRRRGAVA